MQYSIVDEVIKMRFLFNADCSYAICTEKNLITHATYLVKKDYINANEGFDLNNSIGLCAFVDRKKVYHVTSTQPEGKLVYKINKAPTCSIFY